MHELLQVLVEAPNPNTVSAMFYSLQAFRAKWDMLCDVAAANEPPVSQVVCRALLPLETRLVAEAQLRNQVVHGTAILHQNGEVESSQPMFDPRWSPSWGLRLEKASDIRASGDRVRLLTSHLWGLIDATATYRTARGDQAAALKAFKEDGRSIHAAASTIPKVIIKSKKWSARTAPSEP